MDHHRPPRAGKFNLEEMLERWIWFCKGVFRQICLSSSTAPLCLWLLQILTPGQYHKCTTCIIYEPLCTAACATIVPPVLVPPAVEDGSSTPPHLLQRPLVTCVLCIHYHRHISSPLSHHRHHHSPTTQQPLWHRSEWLSIIINCWNHCQCSPRNTDYNKFSALYGQPNKWTSKSVICAFIIDHKSTKR